MIGADLGFRLRAGERLIWDGSPDVNAYTFAASWFLIPFSVLWGGFAIFWEVGVIVSGAPPFFWLWGIPFVLVGLYITVGRFFFARREGQRTRYVLTNQRVVIRAGTLRARLTELDLTNLPPIQLSSARFGTGTITFGQAAPYQRWLGSSWFGMGAVNPEFSSIAGAESVFGMVSEARQEAMREAFGSK